MDLNVLLGQSQLGGQKLRNLDSLIALHLNNFPQFFILDNVTVTGKVLLQHLQDLLQVVLIGNTLHCGQRLSPVSLLDPDVDVVGGLSFGITGVGKRV